MKVIQGNTCKIRAVSDQVFQTNLEMYYDITYNEIINCEQFGQIANTLTCMAMYVFDVLNIENVVSICTFDNSYVCI